ncbi:unnamed protein product [Bursaphelenchus xylophilus]|uniref:(pine wood nematode) hypothetical protein n=1 Tax=Bursaphelenchus xylophilus TaxID=6326 RepID=A0A1I7RZ42_BURXY|nr:unnamed protein product [Bursaphelenchus xylophilus]CAG9106877.1 unnamed protein product [Bursaphelenchus xylophilus]
MKIWKGLRRGWKGTKILWRLERLDGGGTGAKSDGDIARCTLKRPDFSTKFMPKPGTQAVFVSGFQRLWPFSASLSSLLFLKAL